MLIISSREFRQNQKKYFDKADKGEQIIVQRGKDDVYFDAEMVEKIKQSIKQVEQGKVKLVKTPEELSNLLGL